MMPDKITNPTDYDSLRHLVLSWAARGLLTMTEGWKDRKVLLLGKTVDAATEAAANALHDQGLLVNVPSTIVVRGGINVTNSGSKQLDAWDRFAAGVQ